MRKVIQIAVDSLPDNRGCDCYQELFALCDDGSIWLCEPNKGNNFKLEWQQLPPVPQEQSND
jgi:hypothetical protein